MKWRNLFRRMKTAPAPHDDFWYSPYGAGQPTLSGTKVDEQTAITYLAVYDCVTLIAADVANLPLLLYRHLPGGGKERAISHHKYDLCHNAINNEITARTWIETGITHNLLWGNHYALKTFNAYNKLIEIWPIDNPGSVEVYRGKDSQLHYKWHVGNGTEIDKTRAEIIHIPGWGFNGIFGLSPITIARQAIGLGLGTEEFGQRFFGSGTHPAGILSMPPESQFADDEEEAAYMKAMKSQATGLGKSHSMMVLKNGENYTPLTMPLNDAQFLESRQFQKLEIAGMYHVPPHKIAIHGANSNYNNEEQENRHYVDSCLMSWLRRWETCLNQQLLTIKERKAGLFFEFLVDGLLRGDSEARSSFYQVMIQNGVMTRNEVRNKENLNPLPDKERADETMVPLNFIFSKDAGVIPDNGMGVENTEPEEERLLEWARSNTNDKETRSIVVRDRLSKRYRPLIEEKAQLIVSRETKAVKNHIKKLRSMRAEPNIDKWLDDFYQDMGEYTRKIIAPVFDSFARAVMDATVEEIGEDIDKIEFDEFLDDYINVYVTRHVSSSVGQIKSLETFDDIDQRMDEWFEKRSTKIADNETVRLNSAAFQTVAFIAGLSTVFRNRGPKTCPWCKSLEGRVVKKGQSLVADGDELSPKGHEPMKINGTKSHPPVHAKCDCFLALEI